MGGKGRSDLGGGRRGTFHNIREGVGIAKEAAPADNKMSSRMGEAGWEGLRDDVMGLLHLEYYKKVQGAGVMQQGAGLGNGGEG